MPRYFFNVHDGAELCDPEGEELDGIESARRVAVRLAGDLLRDHAEQFWSGEEWKLDVTDQSGLILFTLLFIAIDAPCTSIRGRPPDAGTP